MVQTYGTDPLRLLAMPVRLFWSMAGCVEKLRAADQLATLNLLAVANAADGEAYKQLHQELVSRMGAPKPPPRQERSDKSEILSIVREI